MTDNNTQYNIRFNENEINIILNALDNVSVKASEIYNFQRMINRIKNYKNYQVRNNNQYKSLDAKENIKIIEPYCKEIEPNPSETIDEISRINEIIANSSSGTLINPSPETIEALSMIGEIIDKTEVISEPVKEPEPVIEKEPEVKEAVDRLRNKDTKDLVSGLVNDIFGDDNDDLVQEEEEPVKEEVNIDNNSSFRFSPPDTNFNLKENISKLKSAPEREELLTNLTGFSDPDAIFK